MRMFLNYNSIYKSGTYIAVSAEINDEVESFFQKVLRK